MIDRIILSSIFILFSFTSYGQEIKDFTIGKVYSIESKILKSEREILVYLPETYKYNDYTRYPVLYLLDGKKFFHSFTGAVAQMSTDASPQIPEMIVVGIKSQDRVKDSSPTNSLIGYAGKTERGLEVSGGAENFIAFVEKELIPHIDGKYRTNDYRILTGYSFTGLTVMHHLFTNPGTFNSYLTIDFSAWWDNEVSLNHMERFFDTYNGFYKDVFISTVDRVKNTIYPEEENKTWKFIQLFERNRPQSIGFGFKKYTYRTENHHTMPLISFMDGLKYLFRGHMLNYDEMYDSPTKIKEKFMLLRERLGYDISPREDLMNFFGFQFLNTHNDFDKAIFYFQFNTENYSLSFNAWMNLGKAHERKKSPMDKTIYCYKKAHEIQPNNKELLEKIVLLNGNKGNNED